ncbi:phosphotransferase [Erythrobacter sp. HL-111]|uniref:phosphotransferase n=1 Tax=Erythrobacter sp. HL-111 TaxID=1798193 RepID=UPI0006DB2E96|nr:phosphotransferase [Erythrobacter sp. HL-111]KPP90125.1 MAG: Ecdysteroid kinase [Erythrobacteraceae bacterium HL-111]SDR80968.1 Phosphotransferase enzyme family protein [Erythrobacter sp. HL-111]
MDDYPTHADAVTAEWLSDRLRDNGLIEDGRVSGFDWEPIGTGQVGDSVRFHLRYAPEGIGPPTLAAKFGAADETSRGTAALMGLYAKEVGFYREAAPLLGVRVPRVLAAHVSADGSGQVILFEDLGPARGGDQVAGCGIEDARAGIREAAAIHAGSWHRRDLLEADWIRPDPAISDRIAAMYPQAQAVFRERYAGSLEPEYMALCEELAATPGFFERGNEAPQCLVHGDFRLDNMLFDINGGAEPIAILDWQTVTTGKAMTDIGYFLGCGIGNALRRAHEQELLDLWLAEMAARGVVLSRGDIEHDYRIGALHGVSTAVFSAAFVERTERGDANFLSMARGACGLALERNSLAALKETA